MKKFAIANPSKAIVILLIILLVAIVAEVIKLRKFYEENSPYYFWNELVKKNPKPSNVTQQEFEAKNRAGYCWRDRKYYSKEELWHNAMKSLTGRMIYENKLYWDDKVVGAGPDGETLLSSGRCASWKGCRVWRVPVKLTNKELKDYIGVNDDYLEKVNGLINAKKVQSYVFSSDENYINDDFKSKDFILIHQKDDQDYITLYGSNCCYILNKPEWFLIREKYTLDDTERVLGTFVEEAKIPTNTSIMSWGIGNFYLSVTRFVAGNTGKLPKYPEKIFYLNNCGDILYKPYYMTK
ncbi:hypothetical protein [Snodgrassella communis]|uniref:hypothetical protein n=1 Tax=Snodgrassella communis TaxID=2946699 RepID=UPI00286B6D24|nr:hypothetical protein [Snodgrassella communis]WMY91382.1 hypothetical protein PYG29_08065 [Snodgrassella communis]